MKKVILVISVLVISLGSAFGQVDANYKSTLKKMMEVGGSEETFKAAIKQILGMFKQQKTNVPDSVWVSFEKECLKTSIDDLADMLAPVYQKHMTVSDLNEIIKFYQTPVGKKYAEKTPQITQESMQVGQQWGMMIGQKLQKQLQEKGY